MFLKHLLACESSSETSTFSIEEVAKSSFRSSLEQEVRTDEVGNKSILANVKVVIFLIVVYNYIYG